MTGITRPDGTLAEIARMGVARPDGTVTEVREAWVYDAGQWKRVFLSFPPSGMDKAGNQTLPSLNTDYAVTGWTPRSGFPDTQIVADGIDVPDGVTVNISGQLTFAGADSTVGGNMRVRVLLNGTTELATGATPTSGTVATFARFGWKNTTGAPARLTVSARTSSSLGSRNVIAGGSGSYMTVIPV